jgi:uncharacterized protein YwgA
MSTLSGVPRLGGLLKRIGNFDPRLFVSDFDKRLILQKTIYLLQACGLYLGYKFSWYVRGPYSTQLTHDAFELTKVYQHLPAVRFVDPKAESRFQQFLNLMKTVAGDSLMLELLASVHFINGLYPNLGGEQLYKDAKARKPALTRARFREIMQLIQTYDIKPGVKA